MACIIMSIAGTSFSAPMRTDLRSLNIDTIKYDDVAKLVWYHDVVPLDVVR